jgi:hypothetical protein
MSIYYTKIKQTFLGIGDLLFSGNLEIRDNPITIGLCTGQTGFHGEIDEVRIIT